MASTHASSKEVVSQNIVMHSGWWKNAVREHMTKGMSADSLVVCRMIPFPQVEGLNPGYGALCTLCPFVFRDNISTPNGIWQAQAAPKKNVI